MTSETNEPRREEFALLVDAVQDYAIFILGPDGTIHTWNRGAERTMGYTEREIVGRHFSAFYGPEDLESRKPQRELEGAEREGRIEDEGWRIRKDGTRFWANTVITSIRNEDGSLRGFAKVTRDMSRFREAQEQTKVFQLLVSAVRDYAIFLLDPEGRIATWNAGAQRIKGYTPEEIIGRHFSTFYGEEDIANGKPARELEIAKAEGAVEDEGWRVRKDGTRFWANVVITAVRDAQGELRGFAKVTRDITERKHAEETERAYRVAIEANRAKDEFLMTLSHELRTPMTAILGWARILPTLRAGDPLVQEAIASIAQSAHLQARLIDDILDVSRIASGKMRLAPETVDIGRLIMNAVDAAMPTASSKEITLSATLSPDLGTMIADLTRIQQVLWNLLSNAVKFTPRGGEVRVSATRHGGHVQISVSDTGEGIEPAFLPHVFEPFRQAENPHTRVHGGLGLGLSIVRYIAEAHGGTIAATSEGKGKGATFTVTLPVRVVTTNSEAVKGSVTEAARHGDRLRDVDIVFVDDDREARRMIAAVLRSAGANLIALDSPAAALEAIDRQIPDIVITDIAMPEMDGYAFTRAVRQREGGRDVKVIALSAFPAAIETEGVFDAYLAKPIDPFNLIDQVARIALRASA